MKKIVSILIIVFTFQIAEAQNISYGVKGGLNYSNFHGSNQGTALLNNKLKLGINVGGFVKFEIQEIFFLQPELLYSVHGNRSGKQEIFITDANGFEYLFKIESSTNLHYILIPILGKYYMNDKFNLEFGPQFGYMLKGKFINKIRNRTDLPQDILEGINDEESDIEGANKFDLGLNVGIGYELFEQFELGFRYTYGITKVFDRGSPFKNSVLQLSLAYSFN